jgi:hypothetical protein
MVSFEATNLHWKISRLNTTINDSNRALNVLFNVDQRLEPIAVVDEIDAVAYWMETIYRAVWKIDLGSVNLNIREKPRGQARAQKCDPVLY